MLDEAVACAGVPGDGGGDAGLAEAPAVQFGLVAQRVVFGGEDQGRRQAGEVPCLIGETRGSAGSAPLSR